MLSTGHNYKIQCKYRRHIQNFRAVIQKDNGNITALPGSRVQLDFLRRAIFRKQNYFSRQHFKTNEFDGGSAYWD
jgi:hypothetical protein